MPYSRQLPRIKSTGRVTIRLTPEQRDLFLKSPDLPKNLGHALHRAAVRKRVLTIRVDRESLDALIVVGAKIPAADQQAERALTTLLRYLESVADRFEDPTAETFEEQIPDEDSAVAQPREESAP